MPARIDPLRKGLLGAADELKLDLLDHQADALLRFLSMLQRWNATYNLTSVRDPGQMLTTHLVDCLAVISPLSRERADGAQRVVDVGSGAGLPGVVIAILKPSFQVTCVDSVGKKAAFVRQVAAEIGLRNLSALHARVERLEGDPFDVIVSRAFASLGDFSRGTRHLLADGGAWMAMKGRMPADELVALTADIKVFHVEQLQVPGLAAERCIVWMRPRR